MKFLAFSLLLIGIVSTQVITLSTNALSGETAQVLRSPNGIILYSIEPADRPKLEDKTLHGFKVLGMANLDPKQAQTAANALQKAMKRL